MRFLLAAMTLILVGCGGPNRTITVPTAPAWLINRMTEKCDVNKNREPIVLLEVEQHNRFNGPSGGRGPGWKAEVVVRCNINGISAELRDAYMFGDSKVDPMNGWEIKE